MKTTKSELRQIIKEELSSVLDEKAQTYTFTIDKGGKVVKVHKLGKDAATRAFKKLARMHGKDSVSVQPPFGEIEERCQKGYKTHPTRKTKKMFGRTYRNCVKAEGMEEDAMDEIFGLANNISSNILHLSKEDRALIERDLEEIRELAQMEVMDERKLKPTEKKKLKRLEKEVPKKDFTDRYGKEGKSIYYATLTKMAKKGKKK